MIKIDTYKPDFFGKLRFFNLTSILVVPYEHDCHQAKNSAFAYSQLDMNNDIYGPFKHLIKKAKSEITLFHVIEAERDIFSDDAIEDLSNSLEMKKIKLKTHVHDMQLKVFNLLQKC